MNAYKSRSIQDILKDSGCENMSSIGRMAVCSLNQFALDFEGNRNRIIRSIEEAREAGATFRLGPELEVTGYACEDHFYEQDTITHSYQVLAEIIDSGVTDNILCAIGMPVMHQGVRYNCDVYLLNGKIVGIRPKKFMADDGNYREPRWFTAWKKDRQVESFDLPRYLQFVTGGQKEAPIGDFMLEANGVILGSEKCEEMFTANNPGIEMSLDGADMLANGSGSHWQIRKLNTRFNLMMNQTAKAGGVYAYANSVGVAGDRLLFDGASSIVQNGQLLAQDEQFTMKDVSVVTADVDFERVSSYRGSVRSLGEQAASTESFPVIKVDFDITSPDLKSVTKPLLPVYLSPEEEMAKGPALWLWTILRRTGAKGFFLPLSGGADSSAVAAMIGCMCKRIIIECRNGNEDVISEIQRILNLSKDEIPTDPKAIAGKLLHTCYMENKGYSSAETKERARKLAQEIGSSHLDVPINEIVESYQKTIGQVLDSDPKFESQGGTLQEDVALQNIQARARMVLAYALAQLDGVSEDSRPRLVLGSANVDEAIRGYFTKYDCSAADFNPIGGLNKQDLKSFLRYMSTEFPTLLEVVNAKPSAELRPQEDSVQAQTDEEDMGFTYEELREIGVLRKVERLGPVGMFRRLVQTWGPGTPKNMTPKEVAEKVKRYFIIYKNNRHKLTVLPPALHAENYSPDDNRFDLRPFILPDFAYQFAEIDRLAA